MGRQRRRRKQLLDELQETRGYWKVIKEALDHSLWRTQLGRSYGPIYRAFTNEWCSFKS